MRRAEIDHLQKVGVDIRLMLPDIEYDRSQPAGPDRSPQRVRIHDGTARRVQEDDAPLQAGEEVGIGKVVGLVNALASQRRVL